MSRDESTPPDERGGWRLPPLPATGKAARRPALGQSVRAALAMLPTYRLRSVLTMFCIVVAICGVLLIDSFGEIANAFTAEALAQFSTTLVTIASSLPITAGDASGPTKPVVTEEDVAAVRQLDHVVAASPVSQGVESVVAADKTGKSSVLGVYPEMQRILNLTLTSGAFFAAGDEHSGAPVAIIGQTLAGQLFPGADPVGQHLRLGSVDFRVVGVLEWMENNGGLNLHDTIYVPFSTAQQRLFGASPTVRSMRLQVDQVASLPVVVAAATKAVEQQHHIAAGAQDDFQVYEYNHLIEQNQQIGRTIETSMAAIASVALAIGGAGIINVMLASVRQRTREIGVRVAVGARREDVLLQFLTEATALSLAGGVVGVIAGFVVTLIVTHTVLASQIPQGSSMSLSWLPSPPAVAAALAIAVLTGIVFGFLPARRAARLDPIQALRQG